jgi:hypothetical protein
MRKIMTRWIVLAFLSGTLLGFASPLKAEAEEEGIVSGTLLHDACTEASSTFDECFMWVAGFFQGLIVSEKLAKEQHLVPATCLPHISWGEGRRFILKYMQDHPEMLHLEASVIAGRAVAEAFLCKGSK